MRHGDDILMLLHPPSEVLMDTILRGQNQAQDGFRDAGLGGPHQGRASGPVS